MKVRELVAILSQLPESEQELQIATHADNQTYVSREADLGRAVFGLPEPLRIARLQTYLGVQVVIGNVGKRNLNSPNWFVVEELDGGPSIPQEWWRPTDAPTREGQ